jgi:uncharacterized protein (TIRG00374 family)
MFALFWVAGIDAIFDSMAQAKPVWYFLGVLVYLSTYVPLALRWQLLQRSIGINLSLFASFEVIVMSYGLNKLLPANSGDLARSTLTRRYTAIESHADVLGMVFFERVLDVLTLATLLFLTSLSLASSNASKVGVAALGLSVFVGLTLLVVAVPRVKRSFLALLPESIRATAERLLFGFKRISTSGLVAVSSYSIFRWLFGSITFIPLALALDQNVGLHVAIFATGTMSLAALLPLSPGGLGIVDTAGTGTLVLFGFSSTEALSLIVLQRSLGLLLTALVGIAVYNYRSYYPVR